MALRIYLAALLLTNAAAGITGVLMAQTLGRMLIEYRQDHAATASIRAEFLAMSQHHADAIRVAALESRRLGALICEHMTRTGELQQPCPAP